MTRPSRSILGLLIIAGLAAPVRAADVDPLLPAESEGVMFVNVRQILDSKLVQTYAKGQIEQALKGNDAQKNLEKLGLDPLKDVTSITAGVWGKTQDDMNFLMSVKGKFDPAKLFAAAEEQAKKEPEKVAVVSEGDVKLVKFTTEEGKPPVYVTVPSEKSLVAGTDQKMVAKAFGQKAGAAPAIKKDLADLVAAQDGTASVFFCGLTSGKAELPPGVDLSSIGLDSAKLAKQLEKMASMAMTVRLTQDVSLDINMGMKDTDSADDFAGTVDQLLNTAKAFLPIIAGQQPAAQPVVQDVVKTLKSSVKDKDVKVSVKVTSDAIGKVAGGGEDK